MKPVLAKQALAFFSVPPAGLRSFVMGVMVLSAPQGAGKTSFLRAYAARQADCGRSVGGIASPVVFEKGRRIGYDLIDLRGGSRRPLARIGALCDAVIAVGQYQFDGEAIAEGRTAITSAVREGLDVVAIDEVGPLEFRGEGWAPALEIALREWRPGQELIVVVRPALMEELPRRFPSPLWATADRTSPP
jgi:nucleoside-triphosphatase THEP1